MANDFSIIIPTFHEAMNIPELARRIAAVNFGERLFEVLLIDDNSNDGSLEIVNELAKQYPWLKMIVRREGRDHGQSIITGFQQASYPVLITMDADLSHPPEKIPFMLAMLDEARVDVVLGSRYVRGGSIDNKWPFFRKISSKLAAWISRLVLAGRIRDPLSGFLAIRKTTWQNGDPLTPIGWKIGLELMVKCHCKNIREIPIHFSERCLGKSKLNFEISFVYLYHVMKLVKYKIAGVSPRKTRHNC